MMTILLRLKLRFADILTVEVTQTITYMYNKKFNTTGIDNVLADCLLYYTVVSYFTQRLLSNYDFVKN